MNKKKLRIVFIFFILIIALFINYTIKGACNISAGRLYEQGINLFEEEKYSDAYYNFQKISKFSNLYQISLLKQYQCAILLADKKTAYLKALELSKKTKDQNLRPWEMYN